MASNKQYALDIRIQGTLDKSLLNAVNKARNEVKGFSGSIEAAAPFFDQLETAGVRTFKAIGSVIAVTAPQVMAITKHFTETGMAFEKQMSAVEAIAGATPGELAAITEKARELGRQTVFTAEDVGKAMEYMAMAGWDAEEIQNGIEGVIDLTAASGEDVSRVSDIVTDALTAFGMKAEDTIEFANVLAQASASSNTNVEKMGETFKYAAPIAGALGYSIQDTALAIGLMANQGIKASQAGTSLRTIMSEIAGGVEVMGKEIDVAKEGKMRPFIDVLRDMRSEFAKLSEQEKVGEAENIAGKRGMTALLALMNASDADLNSLYLDILNAQESNAASRMAETRLDNMAGDVELFSDAVKDLELTIYNDVNSPLRDAVQWASGIVNTLNMKIQDGSVLSAFTDKVNSSSFQDMTLFLQSAFNGIGQHKEQVISLLKNASDYLPVIAGATAAWGTAVVGYKIISGVNKIAQVATKGGPIAAGLMAVAVAEGYLVAHTIKLKKENAEKIAESLSNAFGDLSMNAEETHNVIRGLLDDGTFDELDAAMKQAANSAEARAKVQEGLEDLEKYNYKLHLGIELTPEESAKYKEQVEQTIIDCQNSLNEDFLKGKMAIDIVFGDSVSGQMIEGDLDDFYTNAKGTLEFYSQQLKDSLNSAFADGAIDIDEAKTISGIMESMKSISERLQTAKEQASWEWFKSEYSGKELTPETFQLMQQEISNQTAEAMSSYEESYVAALAEMYNMYMDEGSPQYDPSLYNAEVLNANRRKLEKYAELQNRGFEFQRNTIMDTYGGMIDAEGIRASMDEAMQGAISYALATGTTTGGPGQTFEEILSDALYEKLSESTSSIDRSALYALYEGLTPQIEEMETLKSEYVKLGMKVPEWINEGLEEAAMIGLFAEDGTATDEYIEKYLNDNQKYQMLTDGISEGLWDSAVFNEESDAIIHEQAVEAQAAIERETAAAAAEAAKKARETVQRTFDIEFNNPLEINPKVNVNPFVLPSGKTNPLVKHNARGAIVTSPILTTFAEDGPEAAIPLDGSSRAISLWRKAGEILGVRSRAQSAYNGLAGGGTEGMQITYAPVMTFTGSVSKEDVIAANRKAQEEFEERFRRMMRGNARVSFA